MNNSKNLVGKQVLRLGERLIHAGYITREQCEAAIEYQKIHSGLFGQILVKMGFITAQQLDDFFVGGRMVLSGERLINAGIITREQLVLALNYQEENGGRLGNTIVALGFASQKNIDDFFQNFAVTDYQKLGEMLVSHGLITELQLEQALLFQRNSGGQLGEILVSMGFIAPDDLYRTLATQKQLGRIGNKFNFSASKKLPYFVALKYNAIIINIRKDVYILAVHDELDNEAMEKIQSYLDKPVEQVLANMNEIESLWEMVYQHEQTEDSIYKLFTNQPGNSALLTFSMGQKITGICLLGALILCLIFNYVNTLLVLNIVLQCMYAIFTVLKVIILIRGLKEQGQLRYTPEQLDAINERNLPVYTILVPMYKEAPIIEDLMQRLDALDYPKHKLDIRILLEEDDDETLRAFKKIGVPSNYTLIVVPATEPHTKPKACNYGLIRARGEITVIYDAEDMPEADQLKKVFLAFKELPESYVCIQSKLNYFNNDQNTLTRWFTQEYSTWFDILLSGVMSIDMPIPLGGTSNHFKTRFLKKIGAWDPFNVTEDADLGIRLYKMKYHTAMLDSYTWEEANSNVKNWIRQRSRWIKGYMQTWLVHMRNPAKLYRELGLKGFIGYQAMVLGTPLIPILNPLFWVMVILWYVFKPNFIEMLFPGALYFIASVQFCLGNFLFIYSNMLGTYTLIRGSELSGKMHIRYSVLLSGILLPVYWVLMSIAGYKALVQLIFRPSYWEKTHHGLTEQTVLKTTST